MILTYLHLHSNSFFHRPKYVNGGLAQMEERPLRMREVLGSIPRFSNWGIFFLFFFSLVTLRSAVRFQYKACWRRSSSYFTNRWYNYRHKPVIVWIKLQFSLNLIGDTQLRNVPWTRTLIPKPTLLM